MILKKAYYLKRKMMSKRKKVSQWKIAQLFKNNNRLGRTGYDPTDEICV